MNDSYIVYISDTETTGLEFDKHDIIELSMIRLLPQEDSSYKEEQRSWLIKAQNPKTITDEALRINGHKREDILHLTKYGKDNYLLPQVAFEQIDSWIMEDNVSSMDRVFGGQNPKFDLDFFKEFYRRNERPSEEDFPFFVQNGNRIIDTKQLMVFWDVCTGRRRKYYNLSSMVKALGVKKEKAHRADADTRMTKDVLLALIKMVRPAILENFKNGYPEDEEI